MKRIIVWMAVVTLVLPSLQVVRAAEGLPLLLDLGAGKCIPCKKMAPILAQMEKDFAGVLNVRFIDVWKAPEEGTKYGIQQIPTQIFFDAEGKELFRHVGFFSREEILAKWKELGFDLAPRLVDDNSGGSKQVPVQPGNGCKLGKCTSK